MKKGKRLLILLAVVAVFGVGAYLLNLNTQKQEAAQEAEDNTEKTVLFTSTADDTAKLAYTYNGDTLSFVKKDDSWVYEPRESFPLDTSAVDSMLSDLESVSAERTVSETSEDEAEYGLDSPAMIITLTENDGTAKQISIGDKNSVTGDYYATVASKDGIYTISSDLYNAFDVTLMDLVTDEDYPTISADNVTAIDWDDGTDAKTLTHLADGSASAYSSAFTWFQKQADGALQAVNDDTVSTFLDAATGITYEGTAADTKNDLSAYGLDNPLLTVTLHYTEDVAQSEVEAALAEEAAAATATPEPVATAVPEATDTPEPTAAPTAEATVQPEATSAISGGLTAAMAEEADAVPTEEATEEPTATPTATPEPMVTVERSITIYLGNMDQDGNVYMTHSKTQRVFLVSSDTMTSLMKLAADDLRLSKAANLTRSDLTGATITMNGETKVITSTTETTTSEDGDVTITTNYQLDSKELKSSLFSLFVNNLNAIGAEAYTDTPVAEGTQPLLSAAFTQARTGFETINVAFYPYDDNFDQAVVDGDSTMLVNKRDVENLQTYFDELVATEPTATPEVTATPAPDAE